jgi:hypothetical protein
MPTPVSYLSGASLSNTVGMFKRGTMAQNLKSSLESGYRWWNGIEVTSSQYLIYSDTYTMGTSTQANSIPVAWSTPDLTDQNLLNLINTLPPRVGQTAFTSLPIALQWLQSSNKFFLIRGGTENIVKSNLEVYLDAGRFDSYIGSGTTVNDLSGNGRNSTLANGASYNTSGVGSFLLDGTDDKLVGAAFTPNITNKTLCGWVKLSSVTQQGGGLINLQGEAGEPFDAIVYNETGLGWGFGSTGFARTSWSGVKETSTNQWVFMCATYANNNYNLYRNGVLILNTTSYNAYTYNFSCRVQMGERHTGGGGVFLAGNVACGMLYSKALSPEEVLQNFNAQKLRFGYYDSVQDGLVLNLDASNYLSYPRSGTTWTDLTGKGNNGTLTNGPTFSGGTTPSIVFDGSDDYVNLGTTLNNYQRVNLPYTMESFVYLNTSNNNEFIIGNTWDDSGFHIRKRGSSHPPANGIRFVLVQDGSNGRGKDSVPLTSGWYHIVGTYNGNGASTLSNYSLYINSSTEGTTDVSFGNPTSITPTNDTNIGRSGDATNYGHLNGAVSEVMIYNRVLTPQEVIQNFESQRVNFGITGITTNGLVLNLDAANNASYGGSGTVWGDISGNEFDGTLINGPTYGNSGTTSNISLDGVDDFISGSTLTNLLNGSTTLTLIIWVYPTNLNNTNAGGSGYKTLVDTPGRNLSLWMGTNGQGQFYGIGSDTGSYVSNFNWENNKWQMVTIIVNSSNGQIIKNNYDVSQTVGRGNTFTQQVTFGNNPSTGGSNLEGRYGNILLYNRALSSAEVSQNYNATKSRFGL